MLEQKIEIINKLGLHARAAAKLVATASQFNASVQLRKAEKQVDGKSIMSVLMLAASQGTELMLIIDGQDEGDALSALVGLISNRFEEPE